MIDWTIVLSMVVTVCLFAAAGGIFLIIAGCIVYVSERLRIREIDRIMKDIDLSGTEEVWKAFRLKQKAERQDER